MTFAFNTPPPLSTQKNHHPNFADHASLQHSRDVALTLWFCSDWMPWRPETNGFPANGTLSNQNYLYKCLFQEETSHLWGQVKHCQYFIVKHHTKNRTFGKLISLFWTSYWLLRQVPQKLAGVTRAFPATHCKEWSVGNFTSRWKNRLKGGFQKDTDCAFASKWHWHSKISASKPFTFDTWQSWLWLCPFFVYPWAQNGLKGQSFSEKNPIVGPWWSMVGQMASRWNDCKFPSFFFRIFGWWRVRCSPKQTDHFKHFKFCDWGKVLGVNFARYRELDQYFLSTLFNLEFLCHPVEKYDIIKIGWSDEALKIPPKKTCLKLETEHP